MSTRTACAANSPARRTARKWKARSATPGVSRATGARRRSRPLEALRAGVVLEPRELAEKGHLGGPDRAVPLLQDDHLGRPLLRRVRVVDLVTVDRQDHVGVLLDRAGFTKVGHLRAL